MKRQSVNVPALNLLELAAALERLQALSIDTPSKRQIEAIIRAASNPGAHDPAVLIAGLATERQTTIRDSAKQINRQMLNLSQRGSKTLMEMSDAEWDSLVDEAAAESVKEII